MEDKQDQLKIVYADYMTDPRFALLRQLPGRHFVPGRGSMEAPFVFVGEAPGHHENEHQKPFVGKAGKVFDWLLDDIGLKREDVFVTNVVKYRPPRNRTPWPSEIDASRPYVVREVGIIQPQAVIAMGAVAVKTLSEARERVGVVHGTVVASKWLSVSLGCLYHPSCGARDPDMRPMLADDMRKVMAELGHGT